MRFSLLLFSFLFINLYGQERYGLSTSPYSGFNYLSYNPALALSSAYQLEIGLGTAGGTIDNHLFTFNNYREAVAGLFDSDSNDIGFKFDFVSNKNPSFYMDYLYRTPSLAVRGEKYAIGIGMNKRFAITIDRFPTQLVNDLVYGFDKSKVGSQTSVPKDAFSGLSWKEAVLNYAFRYDRFMDKEINIGFNLKYIFASEAVVQKAVDNLLYEYVNDSTIYIQSHKRSQAWGFGKGAAFDVGATYTKYETKDAATKKNYKYLFGIAFTDVGKIIYNEGMIHNYSVFAQEIHTNGGNKDSVLQDAIDNFTLGQFYPKGGIYVRYWVASKRPFPSSFFHIQLPTIGRVHLDLKLTDKFYCNTDISYGFISRNSPYIRKPAHVNFTPRYQSDKFDFLLPLSLTDFNQFRIGAAMRIGMVQFGTDRVKTFSADVQGFKGFDFYLSAKIGVEEMEKSVLKPYKKAPPKTFVANNGYINSISYWPGENLRVYYNNSEKVVNKLLLKTITGITIDSIPVKPLLQRTQKLKPWKYGYGYRIAAMYDLPKTLESGIYTLGNNISFIVKPPAGTTPRVLVVIPVVNYAAKNNAGGKSLYSAGNKKTRAAAVSFYRPDQQDHFTRLSKLVAWLNENCNASVGFITEKELDDYNNIKDADVLIIAGDIWYITPEAKGSYDKFIWSGKNAIVFSSSYMNFRIKYKWDGKQLASDKRSIRRFSPFYNSKKTFKHDLGLKYSLPPLQSVKSHSVSIASSPSLLNLGVLNSSGFKVIDLKKAEASAILLKQTNYNPEEIGAVFNSEVNMGNPVFIIKETGVHGYVFYFSSDSLLDFSSQQDKEFLNAVLGYIIR